MPLQLKMRASKSRDREIPLLRENGKAVQRMVTTSAPNGYLVIVTHCVSAGEQVIVGNLQKIRPDAPVQPTSWR